MVSTLNGIGGGFKEDFWRIYGGFVGVSWTIHGGWVVLKEEDVFCRVEKEDRGFQAIPLAGKGVTFVTVL